MVLLRRILGDTLRSQRLAQRRTLREVSSAAKVSLGYLSEVERGQKEASSELLSSICEALGVPLSEVLRDVSDTLEVAEAPAASASVLNAVEPVASLGGGAVGGDGAELEVVGAGVGGNGHSRLEVHLDQHHHLDSHLDARGRHRVVAAA